MQLLPFFLAAALSEAPLPIYYTSDAKGGIERNWQQVAHQRGGACGLDVTGNGLFFRITMRGFVPGKEGHFHLANGDMRPIRYRFRSDSAGEFSKIYVPFRQHRDGDMVSVNAVGDNCAVSVSFPWHRATLRVH